MKITSLRDAGLLIRDRRKDLGLGQQALADRVGVSRKWLVGVENGRARADFTLVLQTLKALDLAVEVGGLTQSRMPDSATSEFVDPGLVNIDAIIAAAAGKAK